MEIGSNYGIAGFDRKLTAAEIATDVYHFEAALHDLAAHPPGNSEALVAFSEAALLDLHDEVNFPEFRQVVEDFMADRPEIGAAYKVQLFWRSFQYLLLNRATDNQYPAAYKNVMTWQTAFRAMLVHEDGRHTSEGWTLQEILAVNNNQTNEPRRYAGVKLAIAAFADVLPPKPSLVDAGCSAGLGQIQIGENIPFYGIDIKATPSCRKALRELFIGNVAIGNNIGFDKLSSSDIKWVEANSYYPSELEDNKFNHSKRRLREFLYRKRQGFKPLFGDLTEGPDGVQEVLEKNDGLKFNVASALTALYEIPKNKRRVALTTLESLSDTLVVVQDFAEIDPENQTNLRFADDIYAPSSRYKLFAKRVDQPNEQPWEHLGTWNNGRCTVFRPAEALISRCVLLETNALKRR